MAESPGEIVIGSVPYLNEKPLTRWFQHSDEGRASGIRVRYEVPSELARLLAAGEIDAALVSSLEYFRTPGYTIAAGVSISGQYEIASVRAFSRVPWRKTESLALDTSSITSAALIQILLADVYDSHPATIHHAPDLDAMLTVADAALLIGDKGMLASSEGLFTIDVGEAWRELTGKPFVYAVWMGPPERLTPHLVRSLQRARDWGVEHVDVIAAEEAARLGCPESVTYDYLTRIMDYNLDEPLLDALEEFSRRARHHSLLEHDPQPLAVTKAGR